MSILVCLWEGVCTLNVSQEFRPMAKKRRVSTDYASILLAMTHDRARILHHESEIAE